MKHLSSFKLSTLLSVIALAGNTWAAVPAGLPGSVQPAQVSQALTNQQPSAPSQVLPPILAKREGAPTGLTKQAQKIKFKLNGIILEGNHVYTTEELRPIYQADLHKTITVAELFNIVQNITNFYRNNGYILTRAILPPQHVKNGVVRIRILEGYISNVDVSGNPHGARCQVLRLGNKIKECRPLELSRLERFLLIENELPATQVRAVLSPSKTAVGASDLTLVTQNSPVMGYVSYDDYGTRYIGPQQMTANIGLNSFITSGDSTQFTITKTPKGGELTYIDLNYNAAIDDEGTRWLIGGTRVHTHPLFVLAPTQTDGLNNNYYTNWFFPIIRTRSESLTLRTGFNYLDSEVTTFDVLLYNDHVRSFDLGGTYNFADRWNGVNFISADFRQGLPILGYSSNTNLKTATTSRPGGRADYTKIVMTVSRLQALGGSPFSLYGILEGQWAFNPVLSSEQFAFGGSQLGRGYDPAEILGDKGAAGSLELRFDLNVGKLMLQSLQFYGFYDAGVIYNYEFIGGVPTKQSATSAGAGVRFFTTKYLSGNFMWTQPLTKPVAALQFIGEGSRPRVFFSVVASFG